MVSEILLGVIGSLVMIVCWGAIILNYERQKLKEAERKMNMYETCVSCKNLVFVRKDVPIDRRFHYVEGSGQLCHDCYDYLYRDK